jgi:hypothetical protein
MTDEGWMVILTYDAPDELDFFEKEFGLSKYHDHDEGIISYIYIYETGKRLILSLEYSSVNVKIIEGEKTILSLSQEDIESICFQAWNKEQVIRVYLKGSRNNFLIYYEPEARVIFDES